MIAEKSANYPSSPTPLSRGVPGSIAFHAPPTVEPPRSNAGIPAIEPLPTAPFCILVLKCARASPWCCGTVIAASGPSLREADGISGLFDSVERLCSTVRRSSPC
jgi:hypothetical protein